MRQICQSLFAIALLTVLVGGCAVVGAPPDSQAAARQPRRIMFNGQVTLASGQYDHDIDGSIDDETDAGLIGLLAEANTRNGFGGGISLEFMGSDDDLFEGQAASPAEATSFEFDPYFLYRMAAGDRFRMPIRIGPWIDVLTLDDENSSDSLSWVSFGLRLAVEPEVVLARSPEFEFSLFSSVSLAGGGTVAHLETSTEDEDFDSSAGAFGFEIGPRFRWSHFFASVSFLHRGRAVDESDTEDVGGVPTVVRGFDSSFDAVALSFGGGF